MRPASAWMLCSTAAMRPSLMAMSRPVRPSGRVAFRIIRSKLMAGFFRLALSLDVRHHQRLGIISAAGDKAQGSNGEKIRQHQKDLARHRRTNLRLKPELECVEGSKQQGAEQGFA